MGVDHQYAGLFGLGKYRNSVGQQRVSVLVPGITGEDRELVQGVLGRAREQPDPGQNRLGDCRRYRCRRVCQHLGDEERVPARSPEQLAGIDRLGTDQCCNPALGQRLQR